MKITLLKAIFIVSIIVIGCSKNNKIERESEPAMYKAQDTDKEMNDAIKIAIQSLDKFNLALESKNPSFENFSLKNRFETPNGAEHIWVTNISKVNNRYSGIIGNLPEYAKDIKLGDTIEIDKDNITDWMYVENGRLRGGYTIRALRNQMSENERQQLDEESGLIIED